ncbi:MAG: radical SAM protein [Candidatus Harrisonbacteria bacterium CG10_big_fil_rev_8_21_14_0_10_40_38]|uniref:Radical SAM protein n=1 Tax=Candidatus Harrisonbacteria bacterium CG10_big_fil_rev_8_21_14_0_10_40_38 TaxID=1974583 RepID=A0A2H0URS3_9BACT|nr:MAG: radical SAM protein [Candidatus Harrisonbacteria bacterium CG10_big_fil_rev_8_21_14_0_10_40_38]
MTFKVLMLYPNVRSETLVPYALALFSSILKREGFEVDLFDTTFYKDDRDTDIDKEKAKNFIVRPYKLDLPIKDSDGRSNFRKKVESFGPDLIIVTSTESTFRTAIRYLKEIRYTKIPVLLGGVFATFASKFAISFPEIDMLCVGEGEDILPELCRRMRDGRSIRDLPNLWIKEDDGTLVENKMGPLVNQDENPLPDYSIFEDERHLQPRSGTVFRIFQIETHRGCPYTCTFCNSPSQDVLYKGAIGTKFFRKRSLERVRREIEYVRDNFGANYIGFWADTFLAWSPKEFAAFCEMYSDIKLPFWCQTRIETLTEENVRMLKDAGVHRMDLGLEHGNEEFRKRVVDRRYSNDTAVEQLRLLADFEIPHTLNNILGLPGETRELADDTISLCRRMTPDTARASIFMPYHGTPLRERAVELEYLDSDFICDPNPNEPIFGMPGFSKDEIKGLLRTFNMHIRFPLNRRDEIRRAEALTPEGDAIYERLHEEFRKTYYSNPEDMSETNLANTLSKLNP